MPMHQPSLALGEKPRRVDQPVAAVFLPSVAASILGLLPTLRARSVIAMGLVPLDVSWSLSEAIKIEISDAPTSEVVHRFRNFGEDLYRLLRICAP